MAGWALRSARSAVNVAKAGSWSYRLANILLSVLLSRLHRPLLCFPAQWLLATVRWLPARIPPSLKPTHLSECACWSSVLPDCGSPGLCTSRMCSVETPAQCTLVHTHGTELSFGSSSTLSSQFSIPRFWWQAEHYGVAGLSCSCTLQTVHSFGFDWCFAASYAAVQ